ncbi:MAG: DUF3303 family protein [Myxococcota bacterium]|nr:DUF3303 family protein [Myxococcota bacterium]
MKFMIYWKPIETRRPHRRQHAPKLNLAEMIEAMETFGIRQESSYLLTDDSGFFIVEAEDTHRVMQLCLPWTDVCNMSVQKIMTDGETQEAARVAFTMIRDSQKFDIIAQNA